MVSSAGADAADATSALLELVQARGADCARERERESVCVCVCVCALIVHVEVRTLPGPRAHYAVRPSRRALTNFSGSARSVLGPTNGLDGATMLLLIHSTVSPHGFRKLKCNVQTHEWGWRRRRLEVLTTMKTLAGQATRTFTSASRTSRGSGSRLHCCHVGFGLCRARVDGQQVAS